MQMFLQVSTLVMQYIQTIAQQFSVNKKNESPYHFTAGRTTKSVCGIKQ